MIALQEDPIPNNFIINENRFLQIPIALIPRIIWPDKPQMTVTRLDWLIADYYRSGIYKSSTGYPSSMFSEWYILGGRPMAVLAGFIIGWLAGKASRWFLLNRISFGHYCFIFQS